MKTEIVTVGTSIEVLAPYLPFGIEVESIGREPNERQKLIGLCYNATELVNVEWEPLRNYWYGAAHCLPVLRPFSQLCQPLEDGTVPAVEVAKMILDLSLEHCEPDYLADIQAHMDIHGDCGVYLPDCGGACVNIYNDWLISAKDTMTPPGVYDYLRSNHFALPVNGRPLVEGLDYIAKSPAPTPIQEETPG